jgi:hypothetical protein
VIDRAALLAVHARDLAVLVLVVGEDAFEIPQQQFLAGLLQDDRAKLVENLALVETVRATTADTRNNIIKVIEHDLLLRQALVLRCSALRLLDRSENCAEDFLRERFEIGGLAIGNDRAERRRDIDEDVECALGRAVAEAVVEISTTEDYALVGAAIGMDVAGDRRSVDQDGKPLRFALATRTFQTDELPALLDSYEDYPCISVMRIEPILRQRLNAIKEHLDGEKA